MDGQFLSILQLIVEDDEEDESYILNVVLPEFLIDEKRHNKVKKRRIVISRDRQEGYRRIFSDYLAHRPNYPEVMFQMLSYGKCADRQDEYLQLSESTAREASKKFCEVINYRFGKKYFRKPTVDDFKMLLHVNEMRGFPGMAGKYCLLSYSIISL